MVYTIEAEDYYYGRLATKMTMEIAPHYYKYGVAGLIARARDQYTGYGWSYTALKCDGEVVYEFGAKEYPEDWKSLREVEEDDTGWLNQEDLDSVYTDPKREGDLVRAIKTSPCFWKGGK